MTRTPVRGPDIVSSSQEIGLLQFRGHSHFIKEETQKAQTESGFFFVLFVLILRILCSQNLNLSPLLERGTIIAIHPPIANKVEFFRRS
jgi:hypothetical protein